MFNQFGDLERAMLRRGNHASAKFWRRVLLPVIERYRHLSIPKFFHGDAAFANPALYRLLEKEGYRQKKRWPQKEKSAHNSGGHGPLTARSACHTAAWFRRRRQGLFKRPLGPLELRATSPVSRPPCLGDDQISLDLKEGENLMLIKLEQIGAGGGVVAAILAEHAIVQIDNPAD